MTSPISPDDTERMRIALALARDAAEADEVPVGAIVVSPEGEIVGRARDQRIAAADPTAHAEILALREAGKVLGDWRLEGCELYVTLEPCPMCAGALVLARIRRLVYGADSPKSGAVKTHTRLLEIETFNHQVEVRSGVLADEASALLSQYFQSKR